MCGFIGMCVFLLYCIVLLFGVRVYLSLICTDLLTQQQEQQRFCCGKCYVYTHLNFITYFTGKWRE